MTNDKRIKNQKAMDYIVYMMVGSYFSSTKCDSFMLEKRLFLYYKDTNVNTQYRLENNCIWYVEKFLKKQLPEHIWNQNVRVVMRSKSAGLQTEIRFIGRDFTLKITSDCITSYKPLLSYQFDTKAGALQAA